MQARRIVQDLLEGGYFSVYDATTDPRLENREEKKAEGIASILVVPVRVNDKAIGVLSLYTSTPREFSEDEAGFLSALAEQGGMAIENARLVERLNDNARLFGELASKLNSSLDIKKILGIMSNRICEALGMNGVTIHLLNKDSGTIDLVAACGLSEDYLKSGLLRRDKAVASVLKGETVVIRDVKTDDRLQSREEALNEGIVSMLMAPLKSGDDVIGVMRLCSKIPQEFPEDTVGMVNALALQGGLAIRNASMYLMLREEKKNLEQEIWSHKSWF
jgi:GAF domain-containing protein